MPKPRIELSDPSRDASRAEFVLGTVQLGLKYGIANEVGQPSEAG